MSLNQEEISQRLKYLDHISLVGIQEHGWHGVLDHERQDGQLFLVDADIYLDLQDAGASDRIEDTVDYSRVSELISRIITGPPCDLLEKVATQIAEETLQLAKVQAVRVCLHKPQAPLGIEKEDVSVTIWRGLDNLLPDPEVSQIETAALDLKEIYAQDPAGISESPLDESENPIEQTPDSPRQVVIAMGGNLGEVSETFRKALSKLSQASGVGVVEVSPLVRTAAVLGEGQEEQPDYLNAVVIVSTVRSPLNLLRLLQEIENEHGRERNEHWGARTLDLDIIDYQDVVSKDERLVLPHSRASQRAFVLLPWSLIAPKAELAGAGEVVVLADYAPDRDGVKEIYPDWITDSHSQTEVGTGSMPLPRWSAVSRPSLPPRVLDDARELHPSGQIPQISEKTAETTGGQETSQAAAPSLPIPYPDASNSVRTPAASSHPLPRISTEEPAEAVILDEGLPLEEIEEISAKQPLEEASSKTGLWQRIKAFFTGKKTEQETPVDALIPAVEPDEDVDLPSPEWQHVPDEDSEISETVAESEEVVIEDPEPVAATEQEVTNAEYGSGRHAGRLVTGSIPEFEESPLPQSLEIAEQQLNTGDDLTANGGEAKSTVERRSILRPTTTGAVPILKPEGDRADQPTAAFDPLQELK
ncbi:2-amino-4-hydroxy-6-hydroxymethyldihydropteridine diphosphokinase [Varibaculum vaginae]|uniref:2-amino-4-hydroxy-6- hydroxymethyldihydropteridine diphosphokinase n=1 Tax=Varibaculum vaginae TaxID=2364797 RepID=UPI00135A0244|nr:2-amino-4-hydroxy-6-hydroxymethyldihydropteridine diphosphokinase [Varibaculum vaginae]